MSSYNSETEIIEEKTLPYRILSVIVDNKPGVLFRVTNLFRARNFNIESITVGTTEQHDISRMTIAIQS
ncbi:MAG TPA: acetolactate synthase small subunit, partial [Nitrososphaeraceae archaeon]|nr:acetolactate synthase small subunit [Nitrososphaeraceae archaeon]